MSACCNSQKKEKHPCPSCKQLSLPVSKKTVLHQLQRPYLQATLTDDFYHCANKDCSLCYFSASLMVTNAEIRRLPLASTAMLCYCFDVSQDAYRDALRSGEAAAIKHFVIQQTKDHLCACDVRNLSGYCCLAAFKCMEADHDH